MVLLPPFAPAVGTAFSGRRRRLLPMPSEGVNLASTGCAAVSAEGIPTAEGKEKGGAAWPAGQAVSHAEKNLWSFFKKTLDFIVSIC